MATTLFLRRIIDISHAWAPGSTINGPDGSPPTQGWGNAFGLDTTQDTGALNAQFLVNTVNGPTGGIILGQTALAGYFASPPLSTGVTISGTITVNLWAFESAMTANAAINAQIHRIQPNGTITEIAKTARVTELGTSSAVNNFTVTPTSTSFSIGDRILLAVFADDAGTMASGATVQLNFGFNASGVDGDSWLQFTETLTFDTGDRVGSQYFFRDTASTASSGAGASKALSTTRGSTAQGTATYNLRLEATETTTGDFAPIQFKGTGVGTPTVEWFTPQLSAQTLSGAVQFHLRASGNDRTSIGVQYDWNGIRCELAICDSDGSGAVVWGYIVTLLNVGWSAFPHETERVQAIVGNGILLSGADTAISSGQRIRVRIFVDDLTGDASVSGSPTGIYRFYYDGITDAGVAIEDVTTGQTSGDSYIIFDQTIVEGGAAVDRVPYRNPMPLFLAR